MRRRHLDHVQLAADAVFGDGVLAALEDGHLGLVGHAALGRHRRGLGDRFEAGGLLGEGRHGGSQQQGNEGATHDVLLKMAQF